MGYDSVRLTSQGVPVIVRHKLSFKIALLKTAQILRLFLLINYIGDVYITLKG